MADLTLAPGITAHLDTHCYGADYLRWLEEMMAAPSQAQWERRPATGDTLWEDDRWWWVMGDDQPGTLSARVPIDGDLAAEYHRLVSAHLRRVPIYNRVQQVSETTGDYLQLSGGTPIVDRQLQGLVLSGGVCPELRVPPRMLISLGDHELPVDDQYRLCGQASQLIVLHDRDLHHCTAPVVIAQNPYHGSIWLECEHLVACITREEGLIPGWIRPDRTHCQLLTVRHPNGHRHYRPEEGEWVETTAAEVPLQSGMVDYLDGALPSQLIVTTDPDLHWPGYTAPEQHLGMSGTAYYTHLRQTAQESDH